MTSRLNRFTIIFAVFLIVVLFEITFFSEIPIDDSQVTDLDTISSRIDQARLPFIENHGQIPSESVKYYAKTFAGTVYVTDSNLVYQTTKKQGEQTTLLTVNEQFLGAKLHPQTNEKSQSIINYFKGSEGDWKTNIPTYDAVSLGQVWNNVNVDLKAHGNNIEKIFTVHPGGNPADIAMSFDGITDLGISNSQELVVGTALGNVSLSKPIGYQIIDGKRHAVPVQYDIKDPKSYGFSTLTYDPKYDLVIDPLFASTFIGGGASDIGNFIALDSSGNVYITGETYDAASDFPTTTGVFNQTHSGNYDAFVSKFNSTLTTLSTSTLIGGSNDDNSLAIALDSSGNVYITGTTYNAATNFPTTTGAFNRTHSGNSDIFVSKFNSALTTLSASTLIGGSSYDNAGFGIALDSSNNVYITGQTLTGSTIFPTTTGAFNRTHSGDYDIFVSKFNSALTTLSASTLIGGTGQDNAAGLGLDSSGNVYITGTTYNAATNFPTTTGAFNRTHSGNSDAFVSKFNSALTTLSASTLIGGTGDDHGEDIAFDSSGNVYVVGESFKNSTNFPTTTSAFNQTHSGNSDAFVSKFNSALTTLSASTLIGGGGDDFGFAIALDSSNNVYITGQTTDGSPNFPTTAGAYNQTQGGNYDVFVSKLNSALSTLSASTLIGGNHADSGYDVVVNTLNRIYITGYTNSTNFPTTTGAFNRTHSGNSDAFVTSFSSLLSSIPSGGSVSISVTTPGGTASTTTPSGATVSITLPSTNTGTITITDTNSGTSDGNISFLGSLVDIDPTGGASCSAGCTISFTFTRAQASNAGFTPSQVKLFHDSNEDGNFQTNETISTTIEDLGGDVFKASGSESFTSKFAVGGIRANAVAAAQSLSAGGFFDFLNSCDPDGFASGQSLKVYEIAYDRCESNKMQILAYSTCGPMIAEVTTPNGRYTLGMSSTQPFLNDKEKKLVIGADINSALESFSILIKDKRDSFTDKIYLNQCSDTKTYSHQTGYTSEQKNPFFYGSYDTIEKVKQQKVQAEPISKENTGSEQSKTNLEQQAKKNHVQIDPEPDAQVKQSVTVDPEPVSIDPEPADEISENSLIEEIIKTFSGILHR